MKTVTIDMRSNKIIKKSDPRKSKMGKNGSNKNNQIFSGKILGYEIPGAKKLFNNKTLQKVMFGAGAVTTGLAVVQLVDNATLNKYAAKKEVRILAAGIAGDIPGAAFQLVKEDPKLIGKFTNRNGNTQASGQTTQLLNRDGYA